MKMLVLWFLLVMPLSCSPPSSPVYPAPSVCHVPAWPAVPKLHPTACNGAVCLSIPDIVALSSYQFHIRQTIAAVVACPSVVSP